MLLFCYVAQSLDEKKVQAVGFKFVPSYPNGKAFKISSETRLVRVLGEWLYRGFVVPFCLWTYIALKRNNLNFLKAVIKASDPIVFTGYRRTCRRRLSLG